MATTYKVLGQSIPVANTESNIYTVPGGTSAVISTMNICNQSPNVGTFRIAVRPSGATLANVHYLAYDTAIAPNDSIALTLGVTLSATDVVTVRSNTAAAVSFSLFGSEIT